MKLKYAFCGLFLILPLALSAAAKFIDKETLEVVAQGKAQKSDSAMRDEMRCKEAARSEALRIAIETLVDMNWPNVKGKVSREKYGEQVTQITQGSIKGGRVISARVDRSGDPVTCTVTLRVAKLNPAATHRRVMQALNMTPGEKTQNLAAPPPRK